MHGVTVQESPLAIECHHEEVMAVMLQNEESHFVLVI